MDPAAYLKISKNSKELLAACLSLQLWPRNWSAFVRLTKICSDTAIFILSPNSSNHLSPLADNVQELDRVAALCRSMIEDAPRYPGMEDYLSEVEWGDTSVLFNGSLYRIFYGGPYDTTYDYWQEFLLYRERFPQPASELIETILTLQDDILRSISVSDLVEEDIEPGHLEVPSDDFIRQVVDYLENFDSSAIVEGARGLFLDAGAAERISTHTDEQDLQEFFQPFVFIVDESAVLPLFPVGALGALPCMLGESINNQLVGGAINVLADIVTEHIAKCGFAKSTITRPTIQTSGERLSFDFAILANGRLLLADVVHGVSDNALTASQVDAKLRRIQEAIRADDEVSLEGVAIGGTHVNLALGKRNVLRVDGLFLLTSFLQLGFFGLEFEPEFEMMSLPSFLGVIAETENAGELFRFLDFYSEERARFAPFSTPIDAFFLFRDLYESIEAGATRFDMVSVDPHWGTVGRFASLSSKCSAIRRVGEMLHPDYWRVLTNEEGVVRVAKKTAVDIRIYLFLRNGTLRISVADEFTLNAGRQFGFMEELIEDVVKWFEARVGVLFKWPNIIIRRVGEDLGGGGFRFLAEQGEQLIVEFNVEELQDVFSDVNDRSQEWRLLESILKAGGMSNQAINDVKNTLREDIDGKPRFTMSSIVKNVAFPEDASFVDAEDRHFKLARRELAITAKSAGVAPGIYEGEAAKSAINSFRAKYYLRILQELDRFPWFKLIQILMQETGARSFHDWMDRERTRQSLSHEVTYDRAMVRGHAHEGFIKAHKNLRLLIEMVNGQRSFGSSQITSEDIGKLIAFSDWFHVIHYASDILHYGLESAKLEISDEFVPSIVYPPEFLQSQENFRAVENSERISRMVTGSADLSANIEPLIQELSSQMEKSLGFRLETQLGVLDSLSKWGFADGRRESRIYLEPQKHVENELASVLDATEGEIRSALDWLVLDEGQMLRVEGVDEPAPMMPIWESKKRPFRYTIRPLIRTRDQILWEPNACRDAMEHWMGSLGHGHSPIEFADAVVTSRVGSIKARVESNLEDLVYRELSEHSHLLEKNLDLAKRFKESSFPKHLGDFDVLMYIEEKRQLVAVECKDVYAPFCIKDARRFRDKLYGRIGKNELGYFDRAERRGLYLRDHWAEVFEVLDWPIDSVEIEVVNTFVVPRLNLWHFYGPREYFLEPHSLNSLLRRLGLSRTPEDAGVGPT